MANATLYPHEKWLATFEQKPFEALDRLLTGRFFMGRLVGNETQEILFRLFQARGVSDLTRLDETMLGWLELYWGSAPASMAAARWAETLRAAFATVVSLDLRQTQDWLRDHYTPARPWLRSLYLSPSRDPEAELLQVLALSQRDQRLLPFWMRLCGLVEDRPFYHASLGLLGLRKLPEADGQPHGDIPSALFGGIVSLANTLDRQAGSKRETEAFLLREVRALMGLYPRSDQYWRRHFLPLLDPESPAADLLGKLDSTIRRELTRRQTGGRVAQRRLWPPTRGERETILTLIKTRPLDAVRAEIDLFCSKHRSYAKQTGDAEFLVKTFSNIGYRILRQDPEWALALMREAFVWAPYDPILWSQRAIIEFHLGHRTRALGLLWEAKRKFPENAHIRTTLADTLRKEQKLEIAEAVYRQAMADFPLNDVCRNGLAEVLRAQDRLTEAETVYRQTKADFPQDVVCRTGLAEVLRTQDKLTEAEAVYRQTMADFPQNAVCRTGLAVVLLQQGNREEGLRLLEQTVAQFPNDPVARGLLQRIIGQETDSESVADVYHQVADAMVKGDDARDDEPSDFDSEPADRSDQEMAEQLDLNDTEIPVESAFNFMDEDDISQETDVGLANLYRLAARQAEGATRDAYLQEYQMARERILTQNLGDLFWLLEQGFGLLDQNPEAAETFFTSQMEEAKQSHVLGFHLGRLQAQLRQGHVIPPKQWQEVMARFAGRRTLISIEHVRQTIQHANGSTLPMLEDLRQQIQRPTNGLPPTLQANEAWLRTTVQHRFFDQVSGDEPFTEEMVPKILENIARNNVIVQGIVEQSLVVA